MCYGYDRILCDCNSSMYILISDVFDRLRHNKLFYLLVEKYVYLLVLRLLYNIYMWSSISVMLNDSWSEYEWRKTDPSPIVFIVYTDGLLDRI